MPCSLKPESNKSSMAEKPATFAKEAAKRAILRAVSANFDMFQQHCLRAEWADASRASVYILDLVAQIRFCGDLQNPAPVVNDVQDLQGIEAGRNLKPLSPTRILEPCGLSQRETQL